MNLLLLLLLIGFAAGVSVTVPEKVTSANDVPQQQAEPENQVKVNPQDGEGDKKVAKRSYGWGPWGYGGYSFGWPWYGGGHGWYGWYPSWPLYYGGHGYGGYGGYRGWPGYGGWYKGW
ncbi:uncharacterized protein LOC128877263 [Hylaeus volcanicus]|uniref:uncharacterized protein LOC128877263 n=1 Tax=Hylaeus volcanicus TaxID=313075 RepID=UPI0023B83D7A|nr:uncharacterized protein LOC128877263 [Hylaeus volcanicus]